MSEKTKKDAVNLLTEMVRMLVSIIEEKDVFLRGHSERVAVCCVNFSKKLNLPKKDVDSLSDEAFKSVPKSTKARESKKTKSLMAMQKSADIF